jgi:pimeloyl-ACP methyl ester carboxylesterase
LAGSLSNTTRLVILAIVGLVPPMGMAQSTREGRVDLGGYRLHTSESGVGTRAVVFESGLGEDVATWNDVAPQVARFARAFAYDRPGLGKSDPSPRPRTVQQMAAELHSLLHVAKVPPPYILVGHSLGGTIVRMFAHSYPTEVAGLVLVDPEDGRLDEMLRSHMTANDWSARQKALDEAMPKMPAAVQAEMNAYKESGKSEDEAFPLPDVPVILLTGTRKNPEFPGNPLEQDLKLELHNTLLARIPGSKHVLAPNSRHYIQNDAPTLVIEAVRDIVNRSVSVTEPSAKK